MKKLFIGVLLLVGAGCKSNPYCLNCKDSGNGVITPEDMTPPTDDLAGTDDMMPQPDLIGQGGPCVPTANSPVSLRVRSAAFSRPPRGTRL